MAYALGSALADLAAAPLADETGPERQACAVGQGGGYLGGGVEAAGEERRLAVGTGTIVAAQQPAGASQRIRSAISPATGSKRRNLSAATRSRATSS